LKYKQLPHATRQPIPSAQNDPLLVQNVQCIIDISRYRLRDVVNTLATLLDNLTKSNSDDSGMAGELAQSELFLLRLLAECLNAGWKRVRKSIDDGTGERISSSAAAGLEKIGSQPSSPSTTRAKHQKESTVGTSSALSLESTNESQHFASGKKQQRILISSPSGSTGGISDFHSSNSALSSLKLTHNVLEDPPALDDPLAKFVLNILSRFLQLSSSQINVDTINHTFSVTRDETVMDPTISNTHALFPSSNSSPSTSFTPSTISQFPHPIEIMAEAHRAAGRILFYLSASNWHVVF